MLKIKSLVKYLIIVIGIFFLGYYVKKTNYFSFFEEYAEVTVLNSPTKNFNILEKGDVASHYFKLKNTGNKDLVIVNIETRCGCTVSEWNTDPIPPNGIDSISVQYDTQIEGPFNRKIIIVSNAVNDEEFVYVKGVVKH